MGKTITVTFDEDIPEEELDLLREKITKVINGEAVPEPEVEGQADPRQIRRHTHRVGRSR